MNGTPKLDKTETPQEIKDKFKGYFDPCPKNPKFNGLMIDWKAHNFVNPPYSEKDLWIKKAIYESLKGNTSVLLLPATPDLGWFHDLILPYCDGIEWIRGRLKFKGFDPRTGSMFVTFRGKKF